MRTTLDLPDGLGRRAKLAAVHRGVSFKSVVVAALERELTARDRPEGRAITFPLVRSKTPGALKLTPRRIHEILSREEVASYEAAGRC